MMKNDERWIPPNRDRVPMNVHPQARAALRELLMDDPTWQEVGFSEFIVLAVNRLRGDGPRESAWSTVGDQVDLPTSEPVEGALPIGSGQLRYVELAWEDTLGKVTFTCTIVDAPTTKKALEEAEARLKARRPEAVKIEEWLQRRVSHKTAKRIWDRMQAGTWEGWLAHGRMGEKVNA